MTSKWGTTTQDRIQSHHRISEDIISVLSSSQKLNTVQFLQFFEERRTKHKPQIKSLSISVAQPHLKYYLQVWPSILKRIEEN